MGLIRGLIGAAMTLKRDLAAVREEEEYERRHGGATRAQVYAAQKEQLVREKIEWCLAMGITDEQEIMRELSKCDFDRATAIACALNDAVLPNS